MSGFDDDEYGPEDFRPAPHPDDRLWRHPAEVAAEMAARAAAADTPHAPETREVPAIAPVIAIDRSRQRLYRGLFATAVAVAVGASALSVGVLTARSDAPTVTAVATTAVDPLAAPADAAAAPDGVETVAASADGNELASRLHAELAASLPRVQAATPDGMREGSGLFVSDDGLIATSAGLVAESDYLLAWTHDGRRWHADLVAVDWFSDVAILRVDAPSTPATFSDEIELWSGEFALAMDHEAKSMELGEIASVAAGAAGDQPGDASSRVQIGSSAVPGSAVVDDAGRVIGMVNQSAAGSTGLHATPGWMVERGVADLLLDGTAEHPWLGIQAQPDPAGNHARVVAVVDGSPADRAGLRAGDLVDAIDGAPIGDSMSLWTLVQMREPGERISLAVTRNGERRLVWATLELLDG